MPTGVGGVSTEGGFLPVHPPSVGVNGRLPVPKDMALETNRLANAAYLMLLSGRAGQIRRAAGWSSRDMSDSLGTGWNAVRDWETTKRQPNRQTASLYGRLLLRLAKELRMEAP